MKAILGFMFIASAITCPIAFGSGALLHSLTGVDFHLVDQIITVAAGPVALGILFLIRWPEGRGNARIRRAIKKQRRFRKWNEVLPELQAGNGTLLVEFYNFGPADGTQWRIWWTPEDVLRLGPELPHIERCTRKAGEIPFVDWCIARYLDTSTGTAFLVKTAVSPPDEVFPEPLNSLAVPFQEIFPSLPVVVLPLMR